MRAIINCKQIHKPKCRNRYAIFQNQPIFIKAFSSYNPLPSLHTQLQGSTHIVADSIRPLRTQLQSLYLLIQPHTQTYRFRLNTIFRKPYHFRSDLPTTRKLPSTPRSLLYLYILMVCRPWVGRHILDYITIFYGGLPFKLTHCHPRSTHFAELLQYHYPKLWALHSKTLCRGSAAQQALLNRWDTRLLLVKR